MELHVHRPGPPLHDHVESITCFAGYEPAHHREKVLPDGAIELIVDLGESPKKLFAGETARPAVDFRRTWIAGMQRRWIVIEAQPNAAMLVIRFRPGGAYPLLALDASELTDSVFSLEDVLGRAAVALRERVLEAADGPGRIAAALGWLTERLAPVPLDPAIRYLTARLDRPAGLRIADLAEETGYSQRHLLALFRRWVGVSPKQYARIRRFGTVLGKLAEAGDAGPDWARLAASHGYADQSHLSHEFGAFAGMTPGAFAAAYRGLDNFLPITLEAP